MSCGVLTCLETEGELVSWAVNDSALNVPLFQRLFLMRTDGTKGYYLVVFFGEDQVG